MDKFRASADEYAYFIGDTTGVDKSYQQAQRENRIKRAEEAERAFEAELQRQKAMYPEFSTKQIGIMVRDYMLRAEDILQPGDR